MVGLSERYSKNYSIIREYVKNYIPAPVKPPIDPTVTDTSYDPDSTVKSIKQQQKRNKYEQLFVCPKCGSRMQERKGKNGAFLGCLNYPKCKYTRDI